MSDPTRSKGALVTLMAATGLLVASACQEAGPLDPVASAALRPQASHVAAAEHHELVPVPYVGVVYGTSLVPAPPPPGCQLFLNTTQEGEASVLGHFTGVGTTCGFNGQMGVTDPPFSPTGGPPYFVSDFTVHQTHTAANGDQLEVFGGGVFVQSLADGSVMNVGSGTIEGGTGRFAGATGEFTIEGGGEEGNAFEGWIAFDASLRAP